MAEDLLHRMQSDVTALEDLIAAKKFLLTEVYGELSQMRKGGKRQTVKQILNLSPVPSVSSGFADCSFVSSVGFLNHVCVTLRIHNQSPSCEVTVEGKVLLGGAMCSSLLFNSSDDSVETLRPQEEGYLIVALPQALFISEAKVNVVVDFSWILHTRNRVIPASVVRIVEKADEAHPLESRMITVEEPMEWKTFTDILACDQREAVRMQNYAMVSLHFRGFLPISTYEFRERFSSFDVNDLGEWQLFVGTHQFAQLLVGCSAKNTDRVDRVFSPCPRSLDAFLCLLDKK